MNSGLVAATSVNTRSAASAMAGFLKSNDHGPAAGSYGDVDDSMVTCSKHHTNRLDSVAAPRVTFIDTSPPSSMRPTATAQSSVSISLTRVAVSARTSASGPPIQVSRSWMWIEWVSTDPPRSPFQVPRQGASA